MSSNAYEVWKKFGSPQKSTAEEIATLEKARTIRTEINTTETLNIKDHSTQIHIALPSRQ
jgi:xylan 1,4-beta-xylosidase